ncbi:MAG: methyltransferase domain-containing protein [Thermoplasmata archaeon]
MSSGPRRDGYSRLLPASPALLSPQLARALLVVSRLGQEGSGLVTGGTSVPPHPFALPQGAGGRVVGWLLVAINSRLNHRAVELLAPRPEARVLEIGFGPGVGLQDLLGRVTLGHVSGIDPSETMGRAAARRNRRALGTGRLELFRGTADRLPWSDGTFDGAMALNNLFFWNPRQKSVLELFRVLRPGARVVIGFHELAIRGALRKKFTGLPEVGRTLGEEMQEMGFRPTGVRIERITTGRGLLMTFERPAGPTNPSGEKVVGSSVPPSS